MMSSSPLARIINSASLSLDEVIIKGFKTSLLAANRWYSTSVDGIKSEDSPSTPPGEENPKSETNSSEQVSKSDVEKSAEAGLTQADYINKGYSKRQAIWLAPDPEKQKHFLPRLSRKERGSYSSEYAAAQFAAELDYYPTAPEVPLYNLGQVMPEIYQPQTPLFNALKAAKKDNPEASIEELAQLVGLKFPALREPPYPGAQPIFKWNLKLVLSAGAVGEPHPLNKKAKCTVHLRDLQREYKLSEDAIRHIAEIAGPRYNPKTGEMVLTSSKYRDRELNREHIMNMVNALVEEGRKLDAAKSSSSSGLGQPLHENTYSNENNQ